MIRDERRDGIERMTKVAVAETSKRRHGDEGDRDQRSLKERRIRREEQDRNQLEDRDLDRETSGELRHTSSRRREKKERRRMDSRRGMAGSDTSID